MRTDFLKTAPPIGPGVQIARCVSCFAPDPPVIVGNTCEKCHPSAPEPGPLTDTLTPTVRDLIFNNKHKSDVLHDASVLLARGSWWEEHQLIIDAAVAAVSLIPATGCWVGAVGERRDFVLTCISVASNGFGDYGEKFIAKFEDADGNLFTWFTGEKCWAAPGETFNCRGTIRDHTQFRSTKENVITNVRLPKES